MLKKRGLAGENQNKCTSTRKIIHTYVFYCSFLSYELLQTLKLASDLMQPSLVKGWNDIIYIEHAIEAKRTQAKVIINM